MREQTHYLALQRQQQQPCADDHTAFIHKSGERKRRQSSSLHARANLPQTSDLIACTRHCASIITACCMCHAVVLRKHQRLLHAACLGLSEKNTLILCGGLAVAVPIARLLHVSSVILEGSTASAGSTHEHSKKRETGTQSNNATTATRSGCRESAAGDLALR